MKAIKKFIGILLITTLVLSSFATVYASESVTDCSVLTESIDLNISDIAEPNVYTPCTGGNGICQMYRRGVGVVYNTDTNSIIMEYGCCWQCKNCYTVMVTSGDPGAGYPIGTYVMMAASAPVSIYYTGCYVTSSEIHYTNSTSLPGYQFIYHA